MDNVISTIIQVQHVTDYPLELIAEMSIALVGFAGVVSALGRSRMSVATLSFRIHALLLNGVTAVVFSVLPIVLAVHGLSETLLWTVVAILLGITQICTLIWAARRVSTLTDDEVPTVVRHIVFTIMTLVVLYLSYGVGTQSEWLSAIYLVCLSASFCVGLLHFCFLVTSIQSSAKEAI